MPNEVNKDSPVDIDALLAMSDDIEHDTTPLQKLIIEQAVLLPQKTEATRRNILFRGQFLRRFTVITACAAIFGIGLNIFLADAPTQFVEQYGLSSEELDFQELIMIEDDILFAQL